MKIRNYKLEIKNSLFQLATAILLIVWLFGLVVPNFGFAQEDDLATLKLKKEELQKQIDELQNQLAKTKQESKSIQRELNALTLEMRQLNLRVSENNLAIKETDIAVKEREARISDLENEISGKKDDLASIVREIDALDRTSLLEVLVANNDLSDFFGNLRTMEDMQKSIFSNLETLKDMKNDLAAETENLAQELQERYQLKKIQEMNFSTLNSKEKEKTNLMKSKKGEEAALQQRLDQAKQSLIEIQKYLSYFLLKGASVSTEDIIRFSLEASSKTGIRPAFLLAILEIETKLGTNVGTGTWRDDMPSSQQAAFLEITKKLGLDPDSVPVSKKVYSSGRRVMWGGAMGPAQFMPKTWLAHESEITSVTGSNPPNPWDMRDALHAMALFLAQRGATDQSNEFSAAKAYLSGNPNCSSSLCNSYASRAIDKASQWEEYLNQN